MEISPKLIVQTYDGANEMNGVTGNAQIYINNNYHYAQCLHCYACGCITMCLHCSSSGFDNLSLFKLIYKLFFKFFKK